MTPPSVHPRQAPAAAASEHRIRVLHVNAGNLYGGVESLLTTLAGSQPLCPAVEFHFATCYEGRSSQEIQAAGAALHVLGEARMSQPWTVWRARERFRDLLGDYRFDVVICHMDWTLAMFGGTARSEGHKVALWAHGFQTGRHWLERLAGRTTPDHIVANSRFTANFVRSRFPSVPVSVIYCPVTPPSDASGLELTRTAMREAQGVDGDTAVILQAGRLEPWKGHRTHLQALAQLRTKQRWVLWMAGGAQTTEQEQYLQDLKDLSGQLGISERVRFLGQRSDVPRLIAASDVFCQPNQEPEPFGLVFVEALWAGRPVVTSGIGGALEIVDASCGVLVKPGDAESLAQSLDLLIESGSLRKRLGAAGVQRALSLCDPASQLEKLRTVLETEITRGCAA